MNRTPTKEMEWWYFRWGMNEEMLSHMEELGKSPKMDEAPTEAQKDLVEFTEKPCKTNRDLIVLATKKILDSFGSLINDPGTSLPTPDWLNYDGSEDSLRIPTNAEGMFTPPYEMEEIPPLACFMLVHLEGKKPPVKEGASGSYAITGTILPKDFYELESILVKTMIDDPAPRKWFDYHVRND